VVQLTTKLNNENPNTGANAAVTNNCNPSLQHFTGRHS